MSARDATADAQVEALERALAEQAESLVREQRQSAEAAHERILAESAERLRQREQHAVLEAKVEGERLVRREVQAAETRLAGELDRLRWALTESVLAEVDAAFRRLVADDARYLTVLEAWLAAASAALPPGDLAVEVRPEDEVRLRAQWAALAARAAPGRQATLASHGRPSAGGLVVRTVDGRARVDQTVEGRRARLADELARVAMERLFASAPALDTLMHG